MFAPARVPPQAPPFRYDAVLLRTPPGLQPRGFSVESLNNPRSIPFLNPDVAPQLPTQQMEALRQRIQYLTEQGRSPEAAAEARALTLQYRDLERRFQGEAAVASGPAIASATEAVNNVLSARTRVRRERDAVGQATEQFRRLQPRAPMTIQFAHTSDRIAGAFQKVESLQADAIPMQGAQEAEQIFSRCQALLQTLWILHEELEAIYRNAGQSGPIPEVFGGDLDAAQVSTPAAPSPPAHGWKDYVKPVAAGLVLAAILSHLKS